ncbi:hypothetical protein ACVIHH_002193 [Bradyrhizobium sp. USDA 4518]
MLLSLKSRRMPVRWAREAPQAFADAILEMSQRD